MILGEDRHYLRAGLRLSAGISGSALHGLGTASHLDPFAVDENIGNFTPGLMEIPPRGLA